MAPDDPRERVFLRPSKGIPVIKRTILSSVLAAFGAHVLVFNDAATIEALNDRLLDLQQQANNLQAAADAEKRQMTEDETKSINEIFAAFEATEAEIEQRKRLDEINAKTAAPLPRKTAPEAMNEADDEPGTTQRPATRTRTFASPRATDQGKWGFRSAGEYLAAVVKASGKGASIDPRLIANAAPTTYGSEGIGADGGFAVPPDFRETIMRKVMGEESLLAKTDQQTSSSNTITFPADETTPWQSSGGIQAYWEQEGGLKTQSKPALVDKTVKLNKLIALVPLTDELLEDAPAMSSYVNRKAPEKINFKVSDAIINGTGVGMPLGILPSPGTVVVAKESGQATATVNFLNLTKLFTAVTPEVGNTGTFIMHPDVWQQLFTMSFPGTGTAVPAFMSPGGLSAAPYGTLFGRPIVTTQAAQPLGSQGDIIFGDLKNYLSVVKTGGIRSDVSIHLWFDYDMTAFRFVLRVGGQPWWNAAVTPYQTGATSRGYYATLQARP